jgi:hypothetical protein
VGDLATYALRVAGDLSEQPVLVLDDALAVREAEVITAVDLELVVRP